MIMSQQVLKVTVSCMRTSILELEGHGLVRWLKTSLAFAAKIGDCVALGPSLLNL